MYQCCEQSMTFEFLYFTLFVTGVGPRADIQSAWNFYEAVFGKHSNSGQGQEYGKNLYTIVVVITGNL